MCGVEWTPLRPRVAKTKPEAPVLSILLTVLLATEPVDAAQDIKPPPRIALPDDTGIKYPPR